MSLVLPAKFALFGYRLGVGDPVHDNKNRLRKTLAIQVQGWVSTCGIGGLPPLLGVTWECPWVLM